MPLMCNLPGVIGVPRIHATTPPSNNAERGGLSWECMTTLHNFTFKKLLITALYNAILPFLPSSTKGDEKLVNIDIKIYPPHINLD